MPRNLTIAKSDKKPGRPKRTRYNAFDRYYLPHKHAHRCGPFTLDHETPERYYVEDVHRTPFELMRGAWILEEVKKSPANAPSSDAGGG